MARSREHAYSINVTWTGNRGTGTSAYTAYDRAHEIGATGKPTIPGSSDPKFRGDPARYNPEELLLASLSACHMLWFLHLCADAKIAVVAYADNATGTMSEGADGSGRFTEVILHPTVTVQNESDVGRAEELHEKAHQLCFIANSVNFPVRCQPRTVAESAAS